MKKSLVLVMVLALVAAFAFADEIGTAALSTDKGVVTAGEAVNVGFTLAVEDNADDVTTIEVMGDEVSDNVFVMLIKDAPNDATYEAQKVVDQDAKKTTYFIKAKELMGTKGKVYAKLVNWKNETVAEATEDFEWKNNTITKTLSLVPPVEGLYTVMAYIEFADGTRMELKGWDGYAQLVALDNYVKETIPGLAAELKVGKKVVDYGAANTLTVNAGAEFMYAKAKETASATDLMYAGVYGEGSESHPSIVWSYNRNGKPGFEDVELVYAVHGDKDDGDAYDYASGPDTDTAYIKFRVLGDSLQEGDCVTTCEAPTWDLWFAIGTGQYHNDKNKWSQPFDFHLLGASIGNKYSWEVVKGAECRGWVKAIFHMAPSMFDVWVYAILGTDYYYDVAGQKDTVEGATSTTSPYYTQNFLESAELNLIVKLEKEDSFKAEFGLLDIPVTKDPNKTTTKAFAAGSLKVGTVDMGGQFFASDVASITEAFDWMAHFILTGIDVDFGNFSQFGLDSINDARVGATIGGDETGVTSGTVFACLEPNAACCTPPIKVGVAISCDKVTHKFGLDSVFFEQNHSLGEYGPVSLSGKFGAILSLSENAAIDSGKYGKKAYKASSEYDWALGLGYEVTGTMTW
jgi:hypothetical protein